MKFVGEKKGKQLRLLNEHETILLILALKKIPNPDKKPRKMWVLYDVRSKIALKFEFWRGFRADITGRPLYVFVV